MSTGYSFPRVVRSEWVKLRTLRSTFWCSVIILLLSLGLAALLCLGLALSTESGTSLPYAQVQERGVVAVTASVQFTSLVAAVLGALVVSGEFGTGMIRSTFAAVPARLLALVAKSLVVAVAMFVLGAVSILLSLLVSAPLLGNAGLHLDLGDGKFWLALLGAAIYLGLITLFAFWVAVIVRNSAGAIAIAIGVMFVLPILANIAYGLTLATWIENVASFLLAESGSQMADYPVAASAEPGIVVLNGWEGGLIMLAWVVVVAVVGSILAKRRDV